MNLRSHLNQSIENSLSHIPRGRGGQEVHYPHDTAGIQRTVEWETTADQTEVVINVELPTSRTLTEIIIAKRSDEGGHKLSFDQQKQVSPTANPNLFKPKKPQHYEGLSSEVGLFALGKVALGLHKAVRLLNDAEGGELIGYSRGAA